MLKVGLTGGYASGKSFVAREFAARGCHVIYADALGHEVLLPGREAYQAAVNLFGSEILNPEGSINRKKLGAIVFSNPELLHRLNAMVHPAVFRLEEKLMAEFEAQDPEGIGILEAAILIETGAYRRWDKLVVTSCSIETQITRAMARDHVDRDEVLRRIGLQLSNEERVRLADLVIDTDGTRDQTVRQVNDVYRQLRQLAEARLR